MKILIAGDFVPQGETARLIEEGNFEAVFGEIPPITARADYSIVNLEAPVINAEPTPIKKSGPNLYCSSKSLDAVKYAGFDCMTLANNHFYDQGEQGVNDTIAECEKKSIEYVGGGRNLSDAAKTLFKSINGETIAIINCCEKEFSIASNDHGGSNPMEPVRIFYAIKEAKSHSDYVLVITHGGIEHYQYPYPQMQELYRFFIDAGADAVVNHHQHCPSGYEVYNGKPIFYGLGNFCFERNNADNNWYKGHIVILDTSSDFEVIPYRQCYKNNGVKFINYEDDYLKEIEAINASIRNIQIVADRYSDYISQRYAYYLKKMEPIRNDVIVRLQNKGLFPKLFGLEQCMNLYNIFTCSAHRSNIISVFDKFLSNEK